MKTNWPVLVLAICFSTILSQAQDVQETQQVVVVEVPVQVVHNGNPVLGLDASNFVLLDEGRRQDIIQVEEVVWQHRNLPENVASSPTSKIRPSDRRHFLLIFDLYFSGIHKLRRATESAQTLVREELQPQDLVSVVVFQPGSGVVIFTGFTDDRERVDQALKQLNDLTFRRKRRRLAASLKEKDLDKFDPLLLSANEIDKPIPGVRYDAKLEAARLAINDRGGTLPGLKKLKKELGKMAHMVKVGIPDGVADGAIRLSYAASLMANAFRDIEGRKYMVLLTEGFPNRVLYSERYGGMVRSHQESMFKVFRQTGWAVHAIDIAGLRPQGANLSQDGLFQMAADTGGKFYKNYNDPGEAFQKMVTNTSVVYRLTFTPNRLENDGSYHRIKVKLKGVPRLAQVQYARRGYYAPSPHGGPKTMSSTDKATLVLGDETKDAFKAKVQALTMIPKDGKSKVSFIFEAPGEAITAGHEAPELELETFVYALDGERQIVDFSAQTFSLDLGKNKFMMARSPRVFANLELPPGTYQLRYLLLNTLSQEYSLGTIEHEVSDFKKNVPILLPPIFPRTFEQELFVNLRAEKFIFEQQDYPYVVGNFSYIPRIDPVLAQDKRQPLVLQVVEAPKGRLEFHHRILDDKGVELSSGRLRTLKRSEVREQGILKVLAQLNLKSFEPGSYRLEVTVHEKDGAALSRHTVGFRIGDPGEF